jgi:transcription initiation factor TFIIIB Brf1 subunit/transcription initiation factor TFIIB
MTTFSCRTCGSPSFTIRGDFTPRAEVCCTSCGAALGTWETVLGETMGLLERLGVPHRRRGAGPLPHSCAQAKPAVAGQEREGGSAQDAG